MNTAVMAQTIASGPSFDHGFDFFDAAELAARLTIPELRHEINQAESRAKVQDTFAGTPYASASAYPHWDYAAACRAAIIALQDAQARRPAPPAPKGFIDVASLKSRTDIVEVAGRYTVLRKAGRNFTGICPFHSENHPSFYVYPDQQTWRCYGACSTGGDVFSFIMKAEGADFKQAAALLGGI